MALSAVHSRVETGAVLVSSVPPHTPQKVHCLDNTNSFNDDGSEGLMLNKSQLIFPIIFNK